MTFYYNSTRRKNDGLWEIERKRKTEIGIESGGEQIIKTTSTHKTNRQTGKQNILRRPYLPACSFSNSERSSVVCVSLSRKKDFIVSISLLARRRSSVRASCTSLAHWSERERGRGWRVDAVDG